MWLVLLFQILNAQDFITKDAKSAEIIGASIQVALSQTKSNTLSWKCADSSCKITPTILEGKLRIKVMTKGKVIIHMPDMPLSLYATNLHLTASNWVSGIKVRGMKSTLDLNNTKGLIDINGSIVNAKINKHEGPIKFDAFDGKVQIVGAKSDIEISQFTGLIGLLKIDGEISVATQNADTVIKDSQGKLKFTTTKGQINLSSFQGEIHGESKEGVSELSPLANSKLYWKADKGRVILDTKNMDGAKVDIASIAGKMQLAPSLKIKTENGWRVARAKLLGSELGSILVRTNKASIRMSSE